jgi:hypothetical protein
VRVADRLLTGLAGVPTPLRIAGLFGLLALAGWGIATGWDVGGLPRGPFRPGLDGHPPDPDAWPRLFTLWLPLGYGLFTLAHLTLARAGASRRHARLDALTYVGLPAFLALELAARPLGDWRAWLGGAYVLLVALKTAILVRAVFVVFVASVAEAPAGPAPTRPLARHLFAIVLLVHVLTAAYLAVAVSTTGDEPYYLLVTESLLRDRDLDLANQFARQDYRPFYWGRLDSGQNMLKTPSGSLYSMTYSGLLAWLLLPGYAVAGRLGAMVTMGAFAAALMVQVFRLGWEHTGSARVAFFTWLFLAFVSPVLIFSAQVYPEIPAALALAFAVRLIRRLPGTPRRDLTLLALCLLALVLLKPRYALLGAPLAGWAVWRLRGGRALTAALGAAAVVALALVALDRVSGGLLYTRYFERLPFLVMLRPYPHMLQSALGFLFDQEFGLLPWAPVYVLAILGLPRAFRRDPEYAALLAAAALYAYPFLHSFEWYGGFSPPFRYLVAVVPVLALPLAHALASARSRALATVAGAGWTWSLGVAFLVTVSPALRHNRATGAAGWLVGLGDRLEADIARFFPTLVNPTPETRWLLPVLVAALLVGTAAVARADARDRPAAGAPSFPRAVRLLSVGCVLGIMAAVTVAGRLLPTLEVQGEHMALEGSGVLFPGSAELPLKAWVLRGDASLSRAVRLPAGRASLTLFAGGYSADDEPPRLVVSLDGKALSQVDVAAGRGWWRIGAYELPLNSLGGSHRLTLTFANGLDNRAAGQVRHVLIDRLRIEPHGRGPT